MGSDQNAPADDSAQRAGVRGAWISSLGACLGFVAFAVFCYSLGLNFQDEGWSENQPVDRPLLASSLLALAISILLFWLGFVQTTRSRN